MYAATLEDLANQDLSYFANSAISKVHIQTVRIKEVDFDASTSVIRFPLQEKYDRTNSDIRAIRASLNIAQRELSFMEDRGGPSVAFSTRVILSILWPLTSSALWARSTQRRPGKLPSMPDYRVSPRKL